MGSTKDFLVESWNKIRYMNSMARKAILKLSLMLFLPISFVIFARTDLGLLFSFIYAFVIPFLAVWIIVIIYGWYKDSRS